MPLPPPPRGREVCSAFDSSMGWCTPSSSGAGPCDGSRQEKASLGLPGDVFFLGEVDPEIHRLLRLEARDLDPVALRFVFCLAVARVDVTDDSHPGVRAQDPLQTLVGIAAAICDDDHARMQ